MISKKIFLILYVIGLSLIPLVLLILPADFFDNGQSVCLSVLLFDTKCYGCGMTRAIQHIFHLDFATAYNFNKISFIVFPILTVVWFGEARRTYKKIKNAP
ncbi:MAG: DUF2752 domain-containing protein [Flavobacteriaceae bacterium]|nr:DUF2752 domain-containing protein [Flavobacteriaceae bacterium]